MKYTKLQNIKNSYNPLGIIEDIIIGNNWDYEKDKNQNIHVEVGGEWCDYHLSYGINEDLRLLYISCALDIKIPENKINDVFILLANINEKLKIGHFEVWTDDSWPVLRQSIPIPLDHKLCRSQVEQSSIMALEECEKFYPAFQMFAWDNKNVKDSLEHLMLETQGEV
ncbi:MAG: hypothetical protein CMP40_03320 [Rickettsiales bacterium]|nr:hypothetical protein [Rickettsiales bacterium]|tara:strand:- start:282 stop:785 length:504 start_codon:yes stop_codon:yes gene_type:complete